nr:uncharacterized protein LOC133577476 isoform X2 [Nerophis lumbriciformis]
MKGFLSTFPTCGVCGSLLCPPPPPPPAPPAKREDRFVTPHMLTYLELCKARVGAGTRERGVQVSAKVDRMVQCSLGPMTLRGEGEGPPPPAQVSGLRFTRPVSTSSLLLERRFPAKSSKQEAGHEDQGEDQGEDQEECGEEAHIQPCRGSNFQVTSSSCSRGMASSTARPATSAGRVLTCGASQEPIRCTTSSCAGSVRWASTPTEWSPSSARAVVRRAAAVRRSRDTST